MPRCTAAARKIDVLVFLEAQYWFYGTFLECIAGKRAWGSKKFYTDITSVLRTGNDKQKPDAVSISDEAFAIVLFKNDRHKWIEKHEKNCCKVQLSMKEWTRKCAGSSQRGMSDKANLADGHPEEFKTLTLIAILYKRIDTAASAMLQRKHKYIVVH